VADEREAADWSNHTKVRGNREAGAQSSGQCFHGFGGQAELFVAAELLGLRREV
jgi:hypothetical protein